MAKSAQRFEEWATTMSKWTTIFFAGAMLMFGAQEAKADSTPVVLTFEGVGNFETVGDFYNGGGGGGVGGVGCLRGSPFLAPSSSELGFIDCTTVEPPAFFFSRRGRPTSR